MKTCIAIVGPSGSGKNTLQGFFEKDGRKVVVSYTTREMRKGEINGKDYYFVSKEEFERMLKNGELVEHVEYCGNYYGCRRRDFLGGDTVIIVEPEGLKQLKEKLKEDAEVISVFLDVPEEIRIERMEKRGDDYDKIMKRINHGRKHFYDDMNFGLIDVYVKLSGYETPEEVYEIVKEKVRYVIATKKILNELKSKKLIDSIYGIKVHKTSKGIEVLLLYEDGVSLDKRKCINDVVKRVMDEMGYENWYVNEFVSGIPFH